MNSVEQLVHDLQQHGLLIATDGLELNLRAPNEHAIDPYRTQLIKYRWQLIRWLAPADACVKCRHPHQTRPQHAYWGVTYCRPCIRAVVAHLNTTGQWPPAQVPDDLKELTP